MNTVPALYCTVLIMKRLPVYNDIPIIQNEFCWDILVLLRNSSTCILFCFVTEQQWILHQH